MYKRQAQGSIAYDGHRYYKATARPTIPVDTLGAGDAFAAGVLHHLAAYIDYRGWTDVADGRFIPASVTSEAPYCGDVCSHRALLVKGAFDTAPINLSYTKRFAYKPVSYTHLDVYKRQDLQLDAGNVL